MAQLPPDIDPKSRFRLPLPKREDVAESERAAFDELADPKAPSIRGMIGPAGIRLWSPKLATLTHPGNRYVRFEAGFSPHEREVAILATARESDSRFEWAAHEPEALKEGVPQATIDAIKHRRSTARLDATDAIIVEFAREIFGARKVTSETFARVLKRFGPRKTVDLVSLMGNYAATAALLCAFDMQLDDGETHLLPVP
jgi:4-carboxymuconolactone decarboxylase